MNLSNQIRNQASLDAKRSATATRCRVLRGRSLVTLMYRAGLIPSGMLIDPDSGYSVESAAMLVIPFYLVEELNDLLSDYRTVSSISKESLKQITEEQGQEAVLTILAKEARLINFLKGSMILVNIDITDPTSKGKLPSGEYDVMVDTLETMHSTAWLITKNRSTNG